MANATSGLVLAAADLINTRGAAAINSQPRLLPWSVFWSSFFNVANNGSGNYRVAGTTVDGGSPVSRSVYLFSQPSMLLVRSATTQLPTGAFEFTGLAPGKYTVMGFDPNGIQNSVTYSHITAVP